MINIKTSGYSISAEGHAGYAEYGSDIVCSAVTGLLYTIAECIRREHEAGNIQDMEITLEPGCALIKCIPVKHMSRIDTIYGTVKTGLEIVADMYPKYVHIENF